MGKKGWFEIIKGTEFVHKISKDRVLWYYNHSCNNVAPVTNLCLGRARHNGAKKKLQLKHKNSLFTLQTFHYNYY
jgi:hypothetical protein